MRPVNSSTLVLSMNLSTPAMAKDLREDLLGAADEGSGGSARDTERTASIGSIRAVARMESRWRAELRMLISLSWPVALATTLRITMYITDCAFLGHLGTPQLTGASLGQAWSEFLARPVWSAVYALNCMCAQAIGSGNPQLAGSWLQLALALALVCSAPLVAAHFCTRQVAKQKCPGRPSLPTSFCFRCSTCSQARK